MLIPACSRDRSSVIKESTEYEVTDVEPSHSGLPTVEDSALNSKNKAHGISFTGNVTISNTKR